MKWLFLIPAVILLLFSCSPPVKSVREDQNSSTYQFNYYPYNILNVEDKELYNTAFNIIRNKLVYLIDKTFAGTPDLIGLIFELRKEGRKKEFEDIMKNKHLRGWNIFDTDAIPLSQEEIDEINSGQVGDKTAQLPKALFFIQKDEDKAVVYVRYWLLRYKNYNFIYHMEKSGRWSVISADDLN